MKLYCTPPAIFLIGLCFVSPVECWHEWRAYQHWEKCMQQYHDQARCDAEQAAYRQARRK